MFRNFILATSLTLIAAGSSAQQPSLNEPLPALTIEDKGELLLEEGEFSYGSWTAGVNSGEVQVLQYIPGTLGGKKLFKPFTDMLKVEFPGGSLDVTTIINMDDALWGTSGMINSQIQTNKEEFPKSTFVLDKSGIGNKNWALGKKGAVLAVIDRSGSVVFLKREAISEQEVVSAIAIVKEHVGE